MEFITATLTIIISALSWGGIFVNNSLINLIENQSEQIDQADLRLNIVPTHKLLKGEADALKLSLQGWEIAPNLRVELLQLETDEIDLDFPKLRGFSRNKPKNWQDIASVLERDLNMGWRFILTQEDLNNLLISEQTQFLLDDFSPGDQELEIIDLSIDLLSENTVIIASQLKIPSRSEDIIRASLQFSFDVSKGHQLTIRDVSGTLNDRKLSSRLLEGFAESISQQLSLKALEKSGVTLRVLKFEVNDDNLEVAGFVNIQPNLNQDQAQ